MSPRSALLPFAFLLAIPLLPAQPPKPFSAPAVSVADGDTLTVLYKNQQLRIRLYAIDAPEKDQPFSSQARNRLAELTLRKTLTIQPRERDQFNRLLAIVLLPDGRNLNQLLVREGLAWWFRRYAPRETAFEDLELKARDERRGLWADPEPTPPWLFRRSARRSKRN